MTLRKIQNKKAAIELSIGTVVIIVIAMSMLILGLVLVRNIFSGATSSVDILNDKVKAEITSLFAEEGSKIAIKLGADKTAKVTAGDSVGIGVGAKAPETADSLTARDDLKFQLEIESDSVSPNNCLGRNGDSVKDWFDYEFSQGSGLKTRLIGFDEFEGRNAFAIIRVEVPESAQACSQKVSIDITDSRGGAGAYAGSSFIIEAQEGGIF